MSADNLGSSHRCLLTPASNMPSCHRKGNPASQKCSVSAFPELLWDGVESPLFSVCSCSAFLNSDTWRVTFHRRRAGLVRLSSQHKGLARTSEAGPVALYDPHCRWPVGPPRSLHKFLLCLVAVLRARSLGGREAEYRLRRATEQSAELGFFFLLLLGRQ